MDFPPGESGASSLFAEDSIASSGQIEHIEAEVVQETFLSRLSPVASGVLHPSDSSRANLLAVPSPLKQTLTRVLICCLIFKFGFCCWFLVV